MLLTLALLALSAEPAKTSSVPYVAVFVNGEDPAADRIAGKIEVDLGQRLAKKNVQMIDLAARFPPPKSPANEGDQLIKDGKEAYDNLDMDAAIKKLTDGVLFFIKHPDIADPKAIAETFVFLGAAELQNNVKTAPKEFQRALILDPDFKPDPKFFAADVQKAFAKARDEVQSRKTGIVLFLSTPAGATLELNGKPVGLTPTAAMEVPAGRYHVRASRPGYVTAAQFPEVNAGDELDLKLDLAPLPAYAASVDLARRLTNPNNFDAKVLPPQASQLAQELQVRYVVLATTAVAKGSTKVNAQVWDVETGDRLRELKFDADEFGMDNAAETIARWIDRPAPAVVVEAKPNAVREAFRRPWVWAVVGVVVVGAAVGAGVAASSPHHHPDFITTGIP